MPRPFSRFQPLVLSAFAAVLAVTIAAAVSEAAPRSFKFRELPVETVEVKKGEFAYRHDRSIPPKEAARIDAYRRGVRGDGTPFSPDIFAVPGRPGYFIVSERGSLHGRGSGLRLVLIKRTEDGYVQLARSRSAGDSYILRPAFYTGRGRTVILADMGAEYAWGIMVVEIAGDGLRNFGTVDVAVPGEDSPEDARPHARLSLFRGYMRVSFATDVIFDPGGNGQRLVPRPPGGEVVFQHNGRKFLIWR